MCQEALLIIRNMYLFTSWVIYKEIFCRSPHSQELPHPAVLFVFKSQAFASDRGIGSSLPRQPPEFLSLISMTISCLSQFDGEKSRKSLAKRHWWLSKIFRNVNSHALLGWYILCPDYCLAMSFSCPAFIFVCPSGLLWLSYSHLDDSRR